METLNQYDGYTKSLRNIRVNELRENNDDGILRHYTTQCVLIIHQVIVVVIVTHKIYTTHVKYYQRLSMCRQVERFIY